MKTPLFTFYKPSVELRKYIRFYIDVRIYKDQFLKKPTVNYPTVFPAINMIYSDKTNDYRVGDNVYRNYRLFAGGMTKLQARFLTNNESALITVFFYPCGFQHIFNISIRKMANCFVQLSDIEPVFSPILLEKVLKETDAGKRIQYMDKYFKDRLAESRWNKPYLDTVVNLVLGKKANIKIKDITRMTGLNERSLRRWFKDDMGISLKEFVDIARINFASVMLTGRTNEPTQKLVYQLGYYDQSHFLKHLKKYLGISSSKFSELKKTFLYHYANIEESNPPGIDDLSRRQ